jgi:hypothetical protein
MQESELRQVSPIRADIDLCSDEDRHSALLAAFRKDDAHDIWVRMKTEGELFNVAHKRLSNLRRKKNSRMRKNIAAYMPEEIAPASANDGPTGADGGILSKWEEAKRIFDSRMSWGHYGIVELEQRIVDGRRTPEQAVIAKFDITVDDQSALDIAARNPGQWRAVHFATHKRFKSCATFLGEFTKAEFLERATRDNDPSVNGVRRGVCGSPRAASNWLKENCDKIAHGRYRYPKGSGPIVTVDILPALFSYAKKRPAIRPEEWLRLAQSQVVHVPVGSALPPLINA